MNHSQNSQMRHSYISDRQNADSQIVFKNNEQLKNNQTFKRAESQDNLGNFSPSNTTQATISHKSKSFFVSPKSMTNINQLSQLDNETSPNFSQNFANFSQLSNQTHVQRGQSSTPPQGLIKFVIRVNIDDNIQEFDTEHDINTKLGQVYMDIAQLKQVKVQSIVLHINGNILPSDNTPLYKLVQDGDVVVAQTIQQYQSQNNQSFNVFNSSKANYSMHSSIRQQHSPINRNNQQQFQNQKPSNKSTSSNLQSPHKKMQASTYDSVQQQANRLSNKSQGNSNQSPVQSPMNSQILDNSSFNPNFISTDHQMLENQLEINIQSTQNYIQLFEQSQQIPVMISLNTKGNFDAKAYQRPPIDLICVMDNSGSMHGEKINMLKETLLYLIDQLDEKDRLGLVLFNSEVTFRPMKSMDTNNKLKLKQYISDIRAQGGTDINLGMTEAFKFIKTRKYCNPVTSVFLLSDGLDSKAQDRVAVTLKNMNINEQFSINCFGFGRDHDPILMNQISKLKDGSFYYIEKTDQVDMFFVDALGGLFSVIGQDVLIKVKSVKELSKDVNIVRNYGDMWHLLTDQDTNGGWEYCIKLNHLLLGTSKDYICELFIPAFANQNFAQNGAEMAFIIVEITAFTIASQPQRIKRQAILNLQVYSQNAAVPKQIKDVYNKEVQMNFLRVKGAKALQDCIEEAQNKRYKQGQQILAERLEDIERAQLGGQAELLMLRNDLIESRQALQPGYFEREGLHKILANQRAHMEQRSKANNLEMDPYQNDMQKEMIKRRMRQKLGLPEEEEEVQEEVLPEIESIEEPSIDLFKTFCKAAKDANVLYILESEIPNLEQYFREQIEPKMIYDGAESLFLNDKIQDCLSKTKMQSLVSELKKNASDIEQVKQNNAEVLNQQIYDEVVKAVQAAGVDLAQLVGGDIDKVIQFLAENGASEIGEMPELSEEFSKKQLKAISDALNRSQTNQKLEKLAKIKGIESKKKSKQVEKDRKLVEEIIQLMRKSMKITNDSDFEQIEVLVKDVMTFKSPSQNQSKNDLDYILDKEIQKIQKNVLYDLQGGLFNIMTLKNFKDYFKQLQQSSEIIN
ncbi:hypothetical protein ABPG74_014284 [Tetrahymena malaccensis]